MMFRILIIVLSMLLVSSVTAGDYEQKRMDMIEEIQSMSGLTGNKTGHKRFSDKVMTALAKVKRHELVPETTRVNAYANRPLPIGHGQTISQPYIVALMTELLAPEAEHKILEVGTGSGYQAAVLAEIVSQVYSIEIIEPLGQRAQQDLQRLGYQNIQLKVADGYYGWKEAGPFDGIIVTAVASHIPPPLIKQLKPGGHMVIPVGGRFQVQQLMLVEKDSNGKVKTRQILPVRFVPLTGGHTTAE
ncbi:protein-L-isoaspartate(D-aspartate) O-methyltransferase [Candidatus Venteria ishoeyi]|uniref:Protein-L-isoaspartate O-methyltransferase n=1 Tax=Candidatus Venteria ishoeyi TaxID=1899563 RepID=A0A1H6FAR3_9GAMM|nr:protein-L-isoaspartate(D-aspartate) O-methyltransferase [Candidatus Venteria ishoeyi]MDM8547272.1 protein-L-isoaspartate(D-aspartate) O-methyltransferase [Candidatus Venteria ishoeyi]SEH06461.1 Protein-L-isoaspartate O-methyltransferase [Candidatus Venteria ishoeyi]